MVIQNSCNSLRTSGKLVYFVSPVEEDCYRAVGEEDLILVLKWKNARVVAHAYNPSPWKTEIGLLQV